jgi:PhnB protein
MPEARDIPQGLVPHIVVSDGAKAIEFYKKAFGGVEISRAATPDGKKIMHAAVRIGESTLFLSDDFPEYRDGKATTPEALGGTAFVIHQYVRDCDAAIKRAADAGAHVTMGATDMFWGDRYGQVKDPFGHTWAFGTPIKK